MLFWILLLSHLIADYPLQTDAMVKAKKTLPGLLMHVSVHFLTMLLILCPILNYQLSTGISLALAVAIFHLAIDYWKNILSKLRPKWVIFTYLQDQLLHILSILFVSWGCIYFGFIEAVATEQKLHDGLIFIYASVFLLSTYVWFITEKVVSYKHPKYFQWVVDTMWPRMMSRAIFFSVIIIGFNIWSILLIITGLLVVWNDLEKKIRYRTITLDLLGVLILTALVLISSVYL